MVSIDLLFPSVAEIGNIGPTTLHLAESGCYQTRSIQKIERDR